jgi:hypothetical protein
MAAKDQFLSKQKRYHPISLPQEFSDEEMAKSTWTKRNKGYSRPAEFPIYPPKEFRS